VLWITRDKNFQAIHISIDQCQYLFGAIALTPTISPRRDNHSCIFQTGCILYVGVIVRSHWISYLLENRLICADVRMKIYDSKTTVPPILRKTSTPFRSWIVLDSICSTGIYTNEGYWRKGYVPYPP